MKTNRIRAIILRHLYDIRHNWARFTDIFFWPMMDVLLWGFLTLYLAGNNTLLSPIMATLLGAIILWSIYFRIEQDVAVSFLNDIWERNILNLFASPLNFREYLTGTMLLGLGKLTITVAAMVVSSYFFYHYNFFSTGWVIMILMANLIFTGWILGIITVSLILRYGTKAEYAAWWLPFMLQPFSAVTIPMALLPGWMQTIGKFLPTSYVFEGLRAVVIDHKISYMNMITASGLNVVYFVLALLLFSFVFRTVKEKGLLAKLS